MSISSPFIAGSVCNAAEPAPLPLPAVATVPSPLVLESVEHEVIEPPSADQLHFRSLNNSSSQVSDTFLNLDNGLSNSQNFVEIALRPVFSPRSSEAMLTDNRGAFGALQLQSGQSAIGDHSKDSIHGNST